METKTKVFWGIAGIGVLGGAFYFGYRLYKEIRYQQELMKEEYDEEVRRKEQALDFQRERVEELKEQLRIQNESLTFDNDEPSWVPNPEIEEMKKRFRKTTVLDADTVRRYEQGEMSEEEALATHEASLNIVHENAWDVNPSYPVGSKDIPLSQVEEDYKKIRNKERGEEMRHDPNSEEAFSSYKGTYLVDIYDEELSDMNRFVQRYQFPKQPTQEMIDFVAGAIDELFNYPVTPVNMYDENIYDRALTRRERFFGMTSIYSNTVTFAEILLEVVNILVEESVDISRVVMLDYMLRNIGIDENTDWSEDLYSQFIEPVMEHTFTTNGRFGFFALENYQYAPDESTFYMQIQRLIGNLMSLDIFADDELENEEMFDDDV